MKKLVKTAVVFALASWLLCGVAAAMAPDETPPEAVEDNADVRALRAEAARLEAERAEVDAELVELQAVIAAAKEAGNHERAQSAQARATELQIRAKQLRAKELQMRAKELQIRAKEEALLAREVARSGYDAPYSSPDDSRMLAYTKLLADLAAGQKGSGVLVIPSGEIDPKGLAAIIEDMNVMTRILDKAVSPGGRRPEPAFMPSPYGAFPPASGSLALYLQDYGAVFVLTVGFPVAPPAEGGETATEPEQTSLWERTRREMYGPMGWGQETPAPAIMRSNQSPYDEAKVKELKRSLLQALKHAANIRNMPPDSAVTVAVLGGGTGRVHLQSTTVRAQGRIVLGGGESTVLTIHVKKADVDAFDGGELTFEDFQGRATVLTYDPAALGE